MKIKYVIALVLALTLALFLFGYTVGRSKGYSALNQADSLFQTEISKYKATIDGLEYKVSEKEQVVMSQREAIRKGELSREEMRKLDVKRVADITRLEAMIDTLLTIPPNTKVVYVDTCTGIPRPAMLLPFSFEKKDKWFSLTGEYNVKGSLQIGLKMSIPLDIIGGVDRDSKKYKVVVTTPNPYIDVLSINSQKLDVPKVHKWGMGFMVGYGTSFTQPKLSPFIGFGLTRNLIR